MINLDDYAEIKNKVRAIERGEMPDVKLNEVLTKLGYRNACGRVSRVSTPIERGFTENCPSPKYKVYGQSLLAKSLQSKKVQDEDEN